MPTLRQYVAEMLRRAPADALGREEAIASLTTTTVVVSALATGTISSQRFTNKWIWRPDTATAADRIRYSSAFTSSSGTITHAGTNYADTTATSEYVFILEHEPRYYMDAVQTTLGRLQRLDRETMPFVQNATRYWIPFSWIRDPGDVEAIALNYDPTLNRNRHFEKWNAYASTGGTLVPDDYTLSGSGATIARSTTARRGQYSAAVTRSTNNATLSQTVSLLHGGVLTESLEGKTITLVAILQASSASQARITVTAGSTSDSSDYHTGGGDWEELSVSIAVPTAATNIVCDIEVNGTDGTVYCDELYLVEASTIGDEMRRGDYGETFLDKSQYRWDQGAGSLSLVLPKQSRKGNYVLYSGRAYPQFDYTRVLSGSADSDSSDAPLDVVAVGAIGRLYEGLAQHSTEKSAWYARMASEFNARFDRMAASHRGVVRHGEGAQVGYTKMMAVPSARW